MTRVITIGNDNTITYQSDKYAPEMKYTYMVKNEKDTGYDKEYWLYLKPQNEEAENAAQEKQQRLGSTGWFKVDDEWYKQRIRYIQGYNMFSSDNLEKLGVEPSSIKSSSINKYGGKRRKSRRNRKSKKTRKSRKNHRKSKRRSRR